MAKPIYPTFLIVFLTIGLFSTLTSNNLHAAETQSITNGSESKSAQSSEQPATTDSSSTDSIPLQQSAKEAGKDDDILADKNNVADKNIATNKNKSDETVKPEINDQSNPTQNIVSDKPENKPATDPAGNLSNLNPGEQNRMKRALQENPWVFLHPYEATYDISAEGDKLGHANRRMSSTSGVWHVEMSTKLKKWFLTFKSEEYSDFVIHENEMNTLKFFSGTKLTFKKDRTIEQTFDWQSRQETGSRDDKKPWTLPIEGMLFDRMSHLVQLRADLLLHREKFDYLISYKGKRFIYSYVLEKSEKLTTPFGDFDTVKLVRTSGDDSSFSIWLCPDLNYFPVKIAQYEQDKPDVELLLSKLEFITPDQMIGD